MRRMGMTYVVGAVVALAILLPAPGGASSHREAPGISTQPAADNTDVYFYVSPQNPDAVVIVGCFWPLEESAGGPNYYHFGENIDYSFHVDNDGDSREDVRYVFRFERTFTNPATALYATGEIGSLDDPDWNYRQTYDLFSVQDGHGPSMTLASDLVVPPVNIGPRTTPNYEALASAAVATLDNGIKVFAGQRDDPFFVDLGAIFDLLGFRAIPGNMGEGVDGVGGYNCQAIVMEVPIELLTRDRSLPTDPADAAAVLGLWSTASVRSGSSPQSLTAAKQVSRLGMPLVNEVVIPIGQKDVWNASRPDQDGQFLSYVIDPELARLIEGVYGITAPPTPRCDLVTIFLTGVPGLNQPPGVVPSEQIRLNVAIKPDDEPDSRFGFLGGDLDGFPNGRRLADDVVDIAERVVEGVAYPLLCDPAFSPHPLAGQLGDGIDANDMPFLADFPYLSTPHQGWEHSHHRVEPAHGPEKQGDVSLPDGTRIIRAVKESEPVKAARFEMHNSAPNPTGGASRISFALPQAGEVTLKVFDISGREVRTVVSQQMEAGSHSAVWDGRDEDGKDVGAGVYLYRLINDGTVADRKVTIVR